MRAMSLSRSESARDVCKSPEKMSKAFAKKCQKRVGKDNFAKRERFNFCVNRKN